VNSRLSARPAGGLSWPGIATSLGVTVQAASERWHEVEGLPQTSHRERNNRGAQEDRQQGRLCSWDRGRAPGRQNG
jgi:hypothetical protein